MSIKEISRVFIQAYNLLLLQRQCGLTHFVLSKKIMIKLRSNCIVLLKTFIQKLYVLDHIVLSSILYKFPWKALFFSLFSLKAVFFPIYTILNKFQPGTIRVDPYFLFKKNDQFSSKAHMVQITLYFHFIFNNFSALKYSWQMPITEVRVNPYSPF